MLLLTIFYHIIYLTFNFENNNHHTYVNIYSCNFNLTLHINYNNNDCRQSLNDYVYKKNIFNSSKQFNVLIFIKILKCFTDLDI